MGTVDIKAPERPAAYAQVFMVTLNSYLLHQFLQEDVDVVRLDAGLLHRSSVALLAVLTVAPHLDNTLSVHQAHVEDHHHPVGRPTSSTFGAFEPSNDKGHVFPNYNSNGDRENLYSFYVTVNTS